jgi:hypothetical protein
MPVPAQVGATGRVEGTVVDANGGAIMGAAVIATDASTGVRREARTDVSGRYALAVLPVGEYTITIEAPGFQQSVRTGVRVQAAVTNTVDASLQVGQMSQQITVTETAPLLNTTQSTTFRQIDTLEMLEVPTSTRSFTHLLTAEVGVATDLPPVLGNDTGAQSPSVNGLRTTSNSLQFNGIDTTNLMSNEGSLTENISPAPETIQEVKLQTSLYDASTGRNGGGNFQLVTKAGTNDIHGSLYWFVQNEAFNANDFFFKRDGIDRPAARRNEGGFTLGGPIARDRLFFFGSYQRTQVLTAFVSTGSSTVDLPAGLDFSNGSRTSDDLIAAFNAARAACGSAPLAITAASPVAVNLFQLQNPATGGFVIPAPNRALDCSTLDADGNPMTRVRNVFPSEFKQDQFNLRSDLVISDANRLSGTFFFSNFPSLDSFPDPSSLASPFVLQRHNRARTFAVSDTHIFSPTLINDLRVGMLWLNNTRSLDDPFLSDALTNDAVGVFNPALAFDNSAATRRLGHYIFRGPRFSFGGPNDSFNKREQMSFNLVDSISWQKGAHALRFGGEYRRHNVNNNLPEEQATEFEKIPHFTSLLRGLTPEADTQFGITEKDFMMTDVSWFIADDWKVNERLTINLGLRWDWFGWPEEKNGLIGNFDPTIADTENPINGFLVPNNVNTGGISSSAQTIINPAVAATTAVDNGHTLNGQDLNNFQPRIGIAWRPFDTNRFVVRSGYGIFFDRPSAAFINTVFSNYPFLREIEVTAPSNAVPMATAFSQQDTTLPLNNYLPMRVVFRGNNTTSTSTYEMRDNTGVTLGADGITLNPNCELLGLSAGGPCRGNIAETFEFRAIDRNMRTPYVQQWNLGFQYEFTNSMMLEMRYVGTKGTALLNALALAQSWDLNQPDAPNSVYQRLNDAYVRAGSPRGALGSQTVTAEMQAICGNRSACLQGVGLAYGFNWPTGTGAGNQDFGPLAGQFDMNLGLKTDQIQNNTTNAIIPFEPRAVFLGINVPEAIILKSTGNSIYHGLQTSFTKRFSHGLQFHAGYTFSRSIDDNSADPGSTAGGGKPDVPNTGFIVQGDSRNTAANRSVSDFDRPHRFSLSFVYDIPTGGSQNRLIRGWQLAGFTQVQSGAPYTIFSAEPEGRSASALASLNNGPGGLYRLGFGRPNLAPGATLESLVDTGEATVAFDTTQLVSSFGTFGFMGRNVLRADRQSRFDMAVSKTTHITERYSVEFRTEFINLFNTVNFAPPVNDLQDSAVGDIEQTIGGPRVVQFGARFIF